MNLMGIVQDIVNTVACGLCEDGDIANNRGSTANLLFGAHYLLQLANGAVLESHKRARDGGEA